MSADCAARTTIGILLFFCPPRHEPNTGARGSKPFSYVAIRAHGSAASSEIDQSIGTLLKQMDFSFPRQILNQNSGKRKSISWGMAPVMAHLFNKTLL
jgi:hypothetical protein